MGLRIRELSLLGHTTLPYLPDLLHAGGYHTAAFVGSILSDPKDGLFQVYDRGFNVYDAGFHQSQHGESRFQSIERRGDQVVTRATTFLAKNQPRPFFLWVQLHDPEVPYGTSYDRGVAAADAAVGKLVSYLQAQSFYDDALIVVAASQGESLGAHGENTHGIFLTCCDRDGVEDVKRDNFPAATRRLQIIGPSSH